MAQAVCGLKRRALKGVFGLTVLDGSPLKSDVRRRLLEERPLTLDGLRSRKESRRWKVVARRESMDEHRE
jgi:hypothetical protein